MIAQVSKIPIHLQEQIARDYESGMSVFLVQEKWARVGKKAIYQFLHQRQIMRPKPQERQENEPDEKEIERRRDLIKNSWTAEQAKSRWIARSRPRMEALGHSLSQLIPD